MRDALLMKVTKLMASILKKLAHSTVMDSLVAVQERRQMNPGLDPANIETVILISVYL